jgi:hypothetical protein
VADPKKPVDPQQEVEMQIGELEERVDRLRAIYEQYFMGYEKLEPTVQRRDVDRRFTNLRKINIRNTALRFRFNVVTQKFNTYAMYWTRICRQIEEGTFKRHVIKANKRFGPGTRRGSDELSIDVDLGDFDVDLEDFENETANVLAEAEAHAALPSDPPPRSVPKPSPRLDGQTDRPARAPSFGMLDDESGTDTLPPASVPPASVPPGQPRVARHAVLPAGVKQRVLVKKGPTPPRNPDAAPNSTPTPSPQPAPVRARMPSVPEGELPPSRRAPEHAPSTSVIRAASPQGHVHRSPAGVVRPAISPSASSVNRISIAKQNPAAPPPSTPTSPAATSVRVPNATPAGANPAPPASPAPSAQRIPAAMPAGSSPRIPAAGPNPALGRPPSTTTPAAAPPRAPLSNPGRVPIGLPSSVNRVATAPPDAKAPPPSERDVGMPPPSQRRPGPMPAAAPARSTPSSPPESERNPPASRRPPPPLPSQLKKT